MVMGVPAFMSLLRTRRNQTFGLVETKDLPLDGVGPLKRAIQRPLTRPDRPYPNESTEVWAVPGAGPRDVSGRR
jgi:hypothetical protein